MALDAEEIADALMLTGVPNKPLVESITRRLESQMGPSSTDKMEELVMKELKELWDEALTGERLPTTEGGWHEMADRSVERAKKGLTEKVPSHDPDAFDDSTEFAVDEAMEKMMAEQLEKAAAEHGLATLRTHVDHAPESVGFADMGKVVAARLGVNQVVRTDSLSTCAGVTLFDPVTKVGAVMHVYEKTKIPTIEDALVEMRKKDPHVEPGRLQVTLMPGTFEGGDTSHLESLREQLTAQGITKVRDFAAEGRRSSTLQLRGDGMVITPKDEIRAIGPETPDSPGSRSRSSSVGSVHSDGSQTSVDAPALPVTSGMGAGMPTTPSHGTVHPPVERGTPEPEVIPRARSLSVGEALGMGKYKQGAASEGLGTEAPSTRNRVGRSGSV